MFGNTGINLGSFLKPVSVSPIGSAGSTYGGSSGAAALTDIPIEDSDYRHGDVGTVDAWTTINNKEGSGAGDIPVPAGKPYLTSITISIANTAAGWAGASAHIPTLTAVQLAGNGFASGGTYRFLGPSMAVHTLGTAAITSVEIPTVTYPLAIPLKTQGFINVAAIQMYTDTGTPTFVVGLTFASKPTPGGYVDADIRNANLTALNTLVTMSYVDTVSVGDVQVPTTASTLAGICLTSALDGGATAVTVGLVGVFKLGGNGLAAGGMYSFPYAGTTLQGAAATGSTSTAEAPRYIPTNIAVVRGNMISCQSTMLGADPGAADVAIGYLWR